MIFTNPNAYAQNTVAPTEEMRGRPVVQPVAGMVDQNMFQPISNPMQGLSMMANAAASNMTQADKIRLGSLFGLGGRGLY